MRKIFMSFLGFSALALIFVGCQQNQRMYSSPDVVEETYVHRYGVPVSQEDWNANGNHGKIVTALASGIMVTRTYESGILDGDTTYSYPHSSAIEKIENYRNGVLQRTLSFYMSGAHKQEIVNNTPQNHSVTTWYESGTPKTKEEFQGHVLFQGNYFGQNSQIDSQVVNYQGTRTQRDDYGQLISVDTIDKGLMTLRTIYHQNGTPKEVIPFVNNNIHGPVKYYFPAGEPYKIEEWRNGVQQGLAIEYLNGEKVSECNYEDGKKHGIERRYRDGHILAQEISWVEGQRQGPCVSYVGNVTKMDWYWQDKQVSKTNYDMITGQGGTKKNIWTNT